MGFTDYLTVRIKYLGLKKGNMEFLLNSIAFNLKKEAVTVE
jgi:hypothetical protein